MGASGDEVLFIDTRVIQVVAYLEQFIQCQ